MNISYNKGIFTFQDGNKTYTWNINNGQITNSTTNRQVQKLGIKRSDIESYFYGMGNLNGVMRLLQNAYNSGDNLADIFNSYQAFQIVDKMNSYVKTISETPVYLSMSLYDCRHYFYDCDFKDIMQAIQETINEYLNDNRNANRGITIYSYNLRDKVHAIKNARKYEKYGMTVEFIHNHRWDLDNLQARISKKNLDLAMYYYYTQKGYYVSGFCSLLETYFMWCGRMDKTPVKTNNFLREYIETAHSYELWSTISKDEKFARTMNKYKDRLQFSYGNYTVVLPTCEQDLIREGAEMHHCVGGYGNNVANQECLIVFIRHKDSLDECYITAQIYLNRGNCGQLGQYYYAYDRAVTKMEDIEFKEKFQEYLNQFEW